MDGSALMAALSLSAAAGDEGSRARTRGVAQGQECIRFGGGVDSFPVREAQVAVVPSTSSGSSDVGSSKLKLTPIVNFAWPHAYFPGQLVTVHQTGQLLAYAIVTPGKREGVVRVVHRQTEQRVLLKGMKGKVKDLAFAHTVDQIILGCVDEFGNMFVFSIKEKSDETLETELLLHVTSDPDVSGEPSEYHRIIWCPYLPEEDDGDEADDSSARLLVLTHDSVAEMWNIDMVVNKYGCGPLNPASVTHGHLRISDHTAPITDASFSPDGTALATASLDGQVKFFQVYMHGSEVPRCLHEWSPHEGKPVSSLFFLDNHREHQPDVQFWKYAVTGANHNSELKVWSCESWTCLQTIQFKPSEGGDVVLKAALDLSARFLLLSDIYRKNVYVLQLQEQGQKMRVVSISEFATPSAFLSMSVFNAGLRKVASNDQDDDDDTFEELEEDLERKMEATVIELILVQPKSLLNCKIVYEDALQSLTAAANSLKMEGFADEEEELVVKTERSPTNIKPEIVAAGRVNNGSELRKAADKITLMSPEAFTGKVKLEIKDEVKVKMEDLKPPIVQARSGGSSPSREVQDILEEFEEQGGLGVDVVVTGEPYDDEDDIEEDDIEDNIIDVDDEEELDPEEDDYKNPNLMASAAKAALNISDPLAVTSSIPVQPSPESKSLHPKSSDWPGVPNIKPEIVDSPSAKLIVDSRQHKVSEASLDAILRKMNEMVSLVQSQRSEINDLREEMRAVRHESKSQLKVLVQKSEQQLTDALKRDSKIRNDALLSGLTQTVSNTMSHEVETVLKQEMKRIAPQVLQQTLQGITSTLEQDVHNRATKADQHLKDAMNKLSQSKVVTDNLSQAITSSLQPAMQANFKDTFVSILIPAFERALQNMLGQISHNLTKGLKDRETQLKNQMTQLKKDQGQQVVEPLIKELKEKLSGSDKVSTERIVGAVRDVVVRELREGFIQHARSLSVTPTVHSSPAGATASGAGGGADTPSLADLLRIVQSQLALGNFDEAFQTALSANNLSLVVSMCEMVNPMQVFNQNPCPISQPSLLALIQQLGHNLENKTEIKHKYLEEAVMALDSQNPMTSHHIPGILEGLQTQLQRYIKQHPNQKMTKQMKMLNMATYSYMNN